MNTPEDRERDFNLREAELQARERELKLREMEAEIYQNQQSQEVDIDLPVSRTQKHHPSDTSMQKFSKKIVKFAKFAGFMVGGIAIIKIGFFVGMWLAYFMMAGIIAAIGYQIFLKED
jgi:hypothetical protein